MRFILVALATLATSALAVPQPEAAVIAMAADAKAIAVKARAASPYSPNLDSVIEAAAVERRTPNLSPFNNIKTGKLSVPLQLLAYLFSRLTSYKDSSHALARAAATAQAVSIRACIAAIAPTRSTL